MRDRGVAGRKDRELQGGMAKREGRRNGRKRERVEVKADRRTDGRRIPDKWIKRKLLNSV